MELKINHLQHYPIGGENALKVQLADTGNIRKVISVNGNQSVFVGADENNPMSYPRNKGLKDIKPLLLPLSALYEDIDGEIPADILFPKEYYSLIDFYEEHNRENQIKSFMNDGLKWCEPFDFWEYLFSKHFDIYGLIDKGLAIDKRSVK